MSGVQRMSISEVRTFLTCRQKWDWSSRNRMNLRPRAPNKHLVLGSCIHEALDYLYEQRRTVGLGLNGSIVAATQGYDEATQRWVEKIEHDNILVPEDVAEYLDLGKKMVANYAIWSHGEDTFAPVVTEAKLEVSYGAYDFVGVVDLVAAEGQKVFLVEHKTHTRAPDEFELDLSLQPLMYVWLFHNAVEDGRGVNDVVYNILLKKAPHAPKVLKSGGLSRSKSQLTTPWLYRQAVEKRGLDMGDYADFIATLDPNRFNVRHTVHVTPERILWWERFLIDLMDEMQDPLITPVDAMWRCSYCGYRSLCDAKYREQDLDLLDLAIAQEYTDREERDYDEEEED